MSDYLLILDFYKNALLGFFALPVPLGDNFPLSFGALFVGIIALILFIHVLKFIFANHSDK